MRHTKRKLITLAACALCLSLMAWGSLAYFTAKDTAHNVIETCGVNIDLQEWADKAKTVPFPETGKSGIMPGAKVTKIAEVKNTGQASAYVRVKVEKSVTKGTETLSSDAVALDFNTQDWTYKDGFYYYNKALEPDETTAPLFSEVTFDKGMDNRYQESKAEIVLSAQATQVANNKSCATDALGWPEE